MKYKKRFLFTFLFLAFAFKALSVNTTLNVNAIANEVLPDTPVEYVYQFYGHDHGLKIQKIKTGRKDMAGNDEVYLLMIENVVNDTFYLVPDNHVYPLFFREFRTKFEVNVGTSDGYRYSYGMPSREYIMAQSKMASIMWSGYGYGFLKHYEKSKADRTYLLDELEEDLPLLKSESAKLWELIDAYYDKLLNDLKGKKYDDMLAKFDGKVIILDRDQTGVGNSGVDIPKITFTRDSDGKLKEMIFSYPFIDGKYYDKPQFKRTITKAANGLFYIETNSSNEALTGFLNGYILPYLDGFLIVKAPVVERYGFGVPECAVSAAGMLSVWDIELMNIKRDGKLFYDETLLNHGGVFEGDELEQYSADWWKTKYIEMSYDRAKDTRNIQIWLPKYLDAVLETAK
jgi:hypothetical protein